MPPQATIYPAPNPFNPNPSANLTPSANASSSSAVQQLLAAIMKLLQRFGLVSTSNDETQKPPMQLPETTTNWAPYSGPRDKRDAVPFGGGQVTASGAPKIELNAEPAPNQYNYTGPAAKNPYFTSPSNPLRPGYVRGFQNWFDNPVVLGQETGPMPANKRFYSTEEGAQEALRIVEQFMPGAKIDKSYFVSGPFSVNIPMYNIVLPNGQQVSAGSILTSYYNGGEGVTTASDDLLKRTLQGA